jgi:hypothetical protein
LKSEDGAKLRIFIRGAGFAREGTVKESSRRRVKMGRRGHVKKCGQKEKRVILKEITRAKSDESW